MRMCLRPNAIRESSCEVVRERLRYPEHDDEGQARPCTSGELKVLLGDRGQNAALHADHGADEAR